MKKTIPILIILLLILTMSTTFLMWENQDFSIKEEIIPKMNGVSFVGGRRVIEAADIEPVKNLGASWICLMPYAFSRADSAKIWFNVQRQWWGEKTEGITQTVKLCREKGLKIMLKPHLWIRGASFTGHFGFEEADKWKLWEQDYEAYILHFAQLADSLRVEMFCIGTELERFTQERPAFWKQLIHKVRQTYSGKLIYAANWDEYPRFPFWEQLDYIGVDAYFPLCEEKNPSIKTLLKAWNKAYQEMEDFSKKNNRHIIFTEFGYRSVDFSTQKPWESYRESAINLEEQAVALDALLQKFSDAEWHAGGFLWKWFDNHENAGGLENTDYTPQNKPAEKIIQKWYTKTAK